MGRVFDERDQAAFAVLSGDANPMHVDAEAARRLTFDRPLVHGLHGVLWALDCWLADAAGPVRLRRVAAEFRAPVVVGEPVALRAGPGEDDEVRLEVVDAEGRPRMEIRLLAEPGGMPAAPTLPPALPPALPLAPPPGICRERDEAGLAADAGGLLPLCLDPAALAALLPRVAGCLPPVQVAALLATTRLVGMECPGLHSVFSGLSLDFGRTPAPETAPETVPETAPEPALRYRVSRYDPRFRFVEMTVEGGGAAGTVTGTVTGTIRALVRARPVAQPSLAALAPLVPPQVFAGIRALVVGGSRGLGETAAKLLAAGGAEVALTYARGGGDAARVAAEIGAGTGARTGARTLRLDVTDPDADWMAGLGDWRPDTLLYFATPRIRPTRDRRFSAEAYAGLHAVYVGGLLAVFAPLAPGLARVFAPSSVYVTERPARFAEYAAAKAAAEAVAAGLASLHPAVRFAVPRLPRLASDQTSADEPEAAPVLLAELLAAFGAAPGAAPGRAAE